MSKRLILDFCRLIEDDPEVRLAVSSALGMQEVRSGLEELRAQLAEVAGEIRVLHDTVRKRFEDVETLRSLVAVTDALRDRLAELAGEVRRLEASVQKLSQELPAVEAGAVGQLEVAVRTLAEGVFGARVEEWEYFDSEGSVYGRPCQIRSLSLSVGGEKILLAARVCASKGDVYELWATGRLYERVTGCRPRLMLIASHDCEDAKRLARELNVELHEIVSASQSSATTSGAGCVQPKR